jgi:ribonuclease Z
MAERFFLIDCGEGTQLQLRRYKLRMGKINHIFISHLHGDHYFGLIGLISSFHLQNRKNDLHIYGPSDVEKIIQVQLDAAKTQLGFQLHFHPVDASEPQIILSERRVEVTAIPMRHSIACTGFIFREKPKDRHILPEKMKEYQVPVYDIYKIKKGEDWVSETGFTVKNEELTAPPTESLSYAFCADTAYAQRTAIFTKGVDVLYHESTFLQTEKALADKTRHSTAIQAAKVALAAQPRLLLIGHYSVRYEDDKLFEDEAKTTFENTVAVHEGMTIIASADDITIKE